MNPSTEEAQMNPPRKARKRSLRLFESAPYLGDNQDLDLLVRYGDRTYLVECKYHDNQDGSRNVHVEVEITGNEERRLLVGECIERLAEQHEEVQGEPPTKLLVATWQKVLNDAWSRVTLP